MFVASNRPARARVRLDSSNSTRRQASLECLEPRSLLSGGALPFGTVASGQISTVGTQDVWTFGAHQGDLILLAMTSTAIQAGFDAQATLRAPSGAQVSNFFAHGYQQLHLDEDGTYTLTVHDNNDQQTGKYTLGLEGVTPISPNPGALVKGGVVSGTIVGAIDLNEWTFSGTQGQIVKLISTSTATQAGFDARADLYAPSGAHVSSFFAGSRQTFTLDETGTYMITMQDSNDVQAGKYTIGFEGISPISPKPIKMTLGGITSGTLSTGIAVDQLTFSGKAGNIFALNMSDTAIQAGFSAQADVYAPSGERLNGGTLFAGGGQQFFTLPDDGTYMIEVHDGNYAQTGKYAIGLEGVSPFSPNPGVLAPGVTRSASNESGLDDDQYTFTARQGDVINVVLKSTPVQAGYSALANLYDSSGAAVTSFFPGTTQFSIPQSGTYMLSVHDNNFAQQGRYAVTLNYQPGVATGGISGIVFLDSNKNGKQDKKETILAGRSVYIDLNNNGKRDAGERLTTTDGTGLFAFYGLKAGTYIVRPAIPSGYSLTAPKAGYVKIVLKKGQAYAGANFGEAKKA